MSVEQESESVAACGRRPGNGRLARLPAVGARPDPVAVAAPPKSGMVDLLRSGASHLIVWHHLAFYGPVSDVAYAIVPALIDGLYEYGRMAVQVFFVIGGYVMARSVTREQKWTAAGVARHVVRRYRRIGLPYLAALLVAIVANEAARRAMDHESVSAPPTVAQLLAHAVFLQDVLHYEPLTAGIWYLAVDFQLGLLVLLVLAVCDARFRGAADRGVRGACFMFVPLAAASLFWLNRDDRLDTFAVYFFGSYFLGMLVAWTTTGRLPRAAFWVYVALVASALAWEWRPRLLVALVTGVLIYLPSVAGARGPSWSWASFWGKRSYSLFLVHFPVCLVVNALLWEYVDERPLAALAGMVLAYVLSLAAAIAFYDLVESRSVPRRDEPGTLGSRGQFAAE
ncbi:MAG: acyltransferase [Planctomycetia bacterium]|nr:acyltransferase [Planctomycetia bacterium]